MHQFNQTLGKADAHLRAFKQGWKSTRHLCPGFCWTILGVLILVEW